jgi:hypothetical protein
MEHTFSCSCLLQTMSSHAIVLLDSALGFLMLDALRLRSRCFAACLCLLAVVLLYTPLAGAAWSAYESSCCKSGQCSIPAHHHQKPVAPSHEHMDCDHEASGTGLMPCKMSCCQDSERSAVASMAFVLAAPVATAVPEPIRTSIEFAQVSNFLRSVKPLSPPPRSLLSV